MELKFVGALYRRLDANLVTELRACLGDFCSFGLS